METDISSLDLHALQQQTTPDASQTAWTWQTCLTHLNRLKTRVSDPLSKVLITGDLNSGKSTLVNALLNKDMLPVDQQPCTSTFCQVYSSSTDTTMKEDEIHAVIDTAAYDPSNPQTYHPVESRHLYKTLVDEDIPYKMLNIYTARNQQALTQQSLLHNDIVDVALIDSPGLNTDSLKTTSIFARQEEIDVVVFVVSAENHFTLSGKEFLMNAAQEKKHIFIVVNRFDNIRDKERCKRLILQQIELVSPSTFAQAKELVHFVSAAHHTDDPDFANLEQSLRSFVLYNRSVSKLVPAKHYLQHVLQHVHVVATANKDKSKVHLKDAVTELEHKFLPDMRDLEATAEALQESIQQLASSTLESIENNTTKAITYATSDEALDQCIASVTFPGIHLSWQYAQNIAGALASHVESQLDRIEDQASQETTECMNNMNQMVIDRLDRWDTNIITDVLRSSGSSKHQRIHINVQARDFLTERRFVNDKKVALVGLGTTGATVVLFKCVSIKDMALDLLHRYLNPLLDGPTANMPSRRMIVNCITAVGLISIGWTAFSFVSCIPAALRANLKIKFQRVVENEKLQENTTYRIAHGVQNLLESKQTEITSRIQQLLEEKEQEKDKLEAHVSQAKSILEQYDALAFRSNALLNKVKASLHENLVEQ
ncbi:transmembrane GTPase fzo1 [Mucor ambiguus]|uniref:Transmembrane GTPase fzo1 n=1 Tax=Mucor ambiguus TaxID=91626 RepID=A0A0C9LTE6_9FUNG|nr:transmembrane GTPase fzo1 [Mucor ambiguus]